MTLGLVVTLRTTLTVWAAGGLKTCVRVVVGAAVLRMISCGGLKTWVTGVRLTVTLFVEFVIVREVVGLERIVSLRDQATYDVAVGDDADRPPVLVAHRDLAAVVLHHHLGDALARHAPKVRYVRGTTVAYREVAGGK